MSLNMTDNSDIPRKLNSQEHDELLAVYQSAIGDIAFFKSQQFTLTNYAILVYVAILGVAKLLKDAGRLATAEAVILFLSALVVLLLGLFVLSELQVSLQEGRGRLERCIDNFSKQIEKRIFQTPVRAEDKQSLTNLFRSILVFGFLAVVWILWIWNCGI